MKKNGLFRSLLIIVVFVLLVLFLPRREYSMQYLQNGEIKTEVFKTKDSFNNRVKELKALGIEKTWLSKE